MTHEQLRQQKIGVFDSGVGGLTVVRELERLLPGEDILYFGDSANCPYGNRSREELLALADKLLDFMEAREVKSIAVACNTLSTLYDAYASRRNTKIFSIAEAGARYVLKCNLRRIGLTATEFTVNSGWYEKLIHRYKPWVKVIGCANRDLAKLVDEGRFEEIPANVESTMDALQKDGPLDYVILGCTHYPIAQVFFEEMAPDVSFIDPAREEAEMLLEWLEEQDLRQRKTEHRLEIFTSGDPAYYEKMCRRLGIQTPEIIKHMNL